MKTIKVMLFFIFLSVSMIVLFLNFIVVKIEGISLETDLFHSISCEDLSIISAPLKDIDFFVENIHDKAYVFYQIQSANFRLVDLDKIDARLKIETKLAGYTLQKICLNEFNQEINGTVLESKPNLSSLLINRILKKTSEDVFK